MQLVSRKYIAMTSNQFKLLAVLLGCILLVQLITLFRPTLSPPFVQNVRLIDSDIPLCDADIQYSYRYHKVNPDDLDFNDRLKKTSTLERAGEFFILGEYLGLVYSNPETGQQYYLTRHKTQPTKTDPSEDPFLSQEEINVEVQRIERRKKLIEEANK